MKRDTVQSRRDSRRGSAAAILQGKRLEEDYFTPEWILLGITWLVVLLVCSLFTPYTHQLDEIKNVLLRFLAPFLLLAAILLRNFRTMTLKTHMSTAFLGVYMLSWIISWLVNPYKAVGERVVWFQLACITFTLVFAWYMTSENKLRRTMIFFVLLSLWSVVFGLFLFAGQNFTDRIYDYMKGSYFWRQHSEWITLFYTLKESKDLYSWILNPDFYAAYLVMLIPLPFSMFFVEDRWRFRSIAAATFLLMNVCLFLTNSNDSFIAMVLLTYPIYFVLLIVYGHFKMPSVPFLLTLILGVLVIATTAVMLGFPQIVQSWEFKSNAIDGREVLWSGGFWPWVYGNDITRSHFDFVSMIFGTGPGGYHNYFPVFRRPDFFDNQINNVTTFGHNWYLDVLLETGLLGFLSFMAFHFRVVYDAIQQIRFTTNKAHRFYQIALVAGLAGIALQNFFSPNNRWAVCGMIYFTMFGLSMGIHHLDNPGEQKQLARGEIEPAGPLALRISAIVLVALFLIRSPLQAYYYWFGATYNNDGLRAMEYADAYKNQQAQYMTAAKDLFEQAIVYNPTFVTSYYKLGNVYNQVGMTDKAIETYERLNSYVPHYSEVHLNLGIMYSMKAQELAGNAEMGPAQLELLEKSYAEIREAARQELKPNVQAMAGTIGQELADYYEKNGKPEKASQINEELKGYYRNIITYEPKLDEYKIEKKKYYTKAQQALIAMAYLTGKPEEARPVLEKMFWENPNRPEIFEALMAYYDRYNEKKAKADFLRESSRRDPLNPDIRLKLAEAELGQNNVREYQRELKRVEVLDPKNRNALSRLFLSFKQVGNKGELETYRSKLQKLGVNADTITTAILAEEEPEESATTATATADKFTSMVQTAVQTSHTEMTSPRAETSTETKRTAPAPAVLTTATE